MKPLLALFFAFWSCGSSLADTPDVAALVRTSEIIALYQVDSLPAFQVDEHGDPTPEDRKLERIYRHVIRRKIARASDEVAAAIRSAVLKSLADVGDGPPDLGFEPQIILCMRSGKQHFDLLIDYRWKNAYLYRTKPETDDLAPAREEYYVGVGAAGETDLLEVLESRGTRPNKSLEPTATAVTNPAGAGFAPAVAVAHH